MRHRVGLYIVLLFILLVSVVHADGIEVTASVNKHTAYIGDKIDYTVTIIYDSTITLIPPGVGANLGQFDVQNYKVEDEKTLDDGRRQQKLWFRMMTFTTGDYVIPPLPIEYMTADSTKQVISSDPIKITIKSVLAEGTPKDSLIVNVLKKQASLESGWPLWLILTVSGAGLLIIALGIWWWVKKRLAKEEVYVDPRPSWEIAFADLVLLKEKQYIQDGELKLFYIELTEIIRRYLGRKFEFEAVELTTSEIDEYLDDIDFDRNFQKELISFLQHADLVKFAKFVPPAEQPDKDWQTAYSLIDKSKEMEVIKPEPVQEVKYIPGTSTESGDIDDEWKYAPPGYRELMGVSAVQEDAPGASESTDVEEEDEQ